MGGSTGVTLIGSSDELDEELGEEELEEGPAVEEDTLSSEDDSLCEEEPACPPQPETANRAKISKVTNKTDFLFIEQAFPADKPRPPAEERNGGMTILKRQLRAREAERPRGWGRDPTRTKSYVIAFESASN